MAVQITIDDVPEAVYDSIAARAAFNRQSMQEFLLTELQRIAARPAVNTWLQEVRRHKQANGNRAPPSAILEARDADRK